MEILAEIEKKHEYLDKEIDLLFEKYRFNDLVEVKKSMRGNFNNNKTKFLETKKENCFNYLNYYETYVNIFKCEKDFVLFSIKNNNREPNINRGLNSYIISQNGYRWIKIITRNSDIINNSFDPDYYGDYCITEEMEKFIDDVKNSKFLPFDEKPELFVVFFTLPNEQVCDTITKLGIQIKCSYDIPDNFPPPSFDTNFQNMNIINVDVNVIITICSELSNLDPNTDIPKEIISRCTTGNTEKLCDIVENKKFILEQLKKYKKRIICQSAYEKLLEFSSGVVKFCPKEVERIKNILEELDITIVEDNITSRIKNMKHPNKLANAVFGSGDYYRAITISAYNSYINYARQLRIFILNIPCESVEFSEKYL
jgi:hypothetical protein